MSVISIGILVVNQYALHQHIHWRYFEISETTISNKARVRIEYFIYTYLKSRYK